MKSGTENKLKFKQLQRALDLALWQARGLLDTLWNFAGLNCPAGDLGRFTNDEIAVGIDWRGDADKLINTLVELHWLDRDAERGLVIHDWREHCEDTVHKTLARRIELFASGHIPNLSRFTKEERTQLLSQYEDRYGEQAVREGGCFKCVRKRSETPENAPALPSHTKPSHTKPSPPSPPQKQADASAPATAGSNAKKEEEAWTSILQRLRQHINEAATAVREARKNDLAPQEVLAVIEHYESNPGLHKPGALHYRIRSGSPGLSPTKGWPPPDRAALLRLNGGSEAKRKLANDAAATEIIKAGQRAGKTENQIRADLAAQNLEWPT